MGNPRNFTDKSLWNPLFAGGVNNVNVSIPGEVNQLFVNAGGPAGEAPVYGSQDDTGKRIWLGSDVIASYTNTTIGTLYGGVYQLVLVDSGATAANVALGHLAYVKYSGRATWSVTDYANADATTLLAGVFLNTITPGNYGFIQVAGVVNVKYKASLTNVAPAIGDALVGYTAGVVDDPTQSGNPAYSTNIVGYAIGTVPAGGATTQMRINTGATGFGLY